MNERGILLSTGGPHHNVLKLKPPMVFRRERTWIFSWICLKMFCGILLCALGNPRRTNKKLLNYRCI